MAEAVCELALRTDLNGSTFYDEEIVLPDDEEDDPPVDASVDPSHILPHDRHFLSN